MQRWNYLKKDGWYGCCFMGIIFILIVMLALFGCSSGGGSDDDDDNNGGNGGNGGNGTTIDNSSFYGTFHLTMECSVGSDDSFNVTIGGDAERYDEDGYLYVPQTSSSFTDTEMEGSTTYSLAITVGNHIVTIDSTEEDSLEDDMDAEYYTLTFSDDYNLIAVNGYNTRSDDCAGQNWGVASRVSSGSPTLNSAYLQYRNRENQSNQYRGWLDFTKNGTLITGNDITDISLLNNSGTPLSITDPVLYRYSYIFGGWDVEDQLVNYSDLLFDSGYSVRYTGDGDIPAGDYTWRATLSGGGTASYDLYYRGKVELPYVTLESMGHVWQPDGSLTLSWTNPSGTYDQIRLVLMDEVGYDLMYIRLPNDAETCTIPASVIQDLQSVRTPSMIRWIVQTRSYEGDDANNNYARGYSDTRIAEWKPGFNRTASGTWSYIAAMHELIVNVTASSFEGCGPEVETVDLPVLSLTETQMLLDVGDDEPLSLARNPGDAGDVVGEWISVDEVGNSLFFNIEEGGAFTIDGIIFFCD